MPGCQYVGMGEVTEYIAGLDEPARSLLERYRQRAMAVAPDAEEGTSYGMAALRYRGRPLISVIRTKEGYSSFPFRPAFDALVAWRRDEIDAALSRPRRR
jgi:uncharacterized protein YdhG (YjbR/CyaY superfamily)